MLHHKADRTTKIIQNNFSINVLQTFSLQGTIRGKFSLKNGEKIFFFFCSKDFELKSSYNIISNDSGISKRRFEVVNFLIIHLKIQKKKSF